MVQRSPAFAVLVLFGAVVAGCSSGGSGSPSGKCSKSTDCPAGQICNTHGFCQTSLGCHNDADCGANRTCDTTSGACLCANDQGCVGDGGPQFCNAAHRCQGFGACQDNSDCPAGDICDTVHKSCIPALGADGGVACGGTIQCPLASICSTANICVPGCTSDGDCPQTSVNSSGVTVYSPEACLGGQCQPYPACSSTAGCLFEQTCNANTCASACSSNNPYCKACDPTSLFGPNCGNAANLCLDDPRNAANCSAPSSTCKYWCGIDCSGGKACPAGFDCGDVVIVTQTTSCTCGQACSNGTGPCQCNEGAASGVCACTSDSDCGAPLSGATCQPNGECLLGQNCFPTKGLYCDAPGPQCP